MAVKISERSVNALTTIIEVEGELDLYSAAQLNTALVRAIEEQQCLRLVVDLRKVTAIDFSTVAIISQNARLLANRHGALEVVCGEGDVAQLLVEAGEAGNFDVRVVESG